jgi:hypothetical protein
MPTYYVIKSGYVRGGQISGEAEVYTETFGPGYSGSVYKGNFVKGRLNGSGICTEFDNHTCTTYIGNFANNVLDGTIVSFVWQNLDPDSPAECAVVGNGLSCANARKYIYRSVAGSSLGARKLEMVYVDGVLASIISDNAATIKFEVTQRDFNNYKIFANFSLIEL